MTVSASLIPELEDVVQNGTPARRAAMLRQVTTLFLDGAPQFADQHVTLFDDVMLCLVTQIEAQVLAELSRSLAPVANAPAGVVRRLAHDDNIAVAGPVLKLSPQLDEPDLKFIAETKSQAHLLALSGRDSLSEKVSDILVERGDRNVAYSVAANPGAQLSNTAFAQLVARSQDDNALAEKVGSRNDIPPRLFRDLLIKATDVVQRRLLASARPETQDEIRAILERVSGEVGAKIGAAPRDYSAALERVRALHADGRLGENELAGYAQAQSYEETIAALSVLCAVPVDVIDRLLAGDRPDPILILGRAAGFSWETVRAIIGVRPGGKGTSTQGIEAARDNFDKLTAATAQRVVRFWQLRPGA
ncbi:MAG TPA: DUF2336 domain-containing protein [Pseudolabrys sp.]|jgi:uncharacterized protein (DUF2336 family)